MESRLSRVQDIIDVWDNTDNNIVVNAVAGSGKTTLLLTLLERCQYRTLFLAFNKSIQEEIQNKMDTRGLKQGKSVTIHSLGLSAIRTCGRKYIINNNKDWVIIKKIQQIFNLYRNFQSGEVLGLSYNLIDMNIMSRMYLTDDIDEIKGHLKGIDKYVSNNVLLSELWEKFVEIREDSYNNGLLEIDFIDMIYLPVKWDLQIPIYPSYLFVDECQDIGLVQHKLIDNFIKQGTIKKWVAVGDKNQAIYAFAGSKSDSFDMFLSKSDNVVEMPLDVCYRCSKNIIDSANQVYDVMESYKEDEGVVKTITDISLIKLNSMVICRNSTPLIEVYFKLLAMGKPCYINGSEIMNHLIKFLKSYIKDTVHSALVEMNYKLSELEEKNSEEDRFIKYIFEENYNNFRTIADNMFSNTDKIEDVIDKLKFLFDDKSNGIMLCTIHKSKGLEADIVYILNENLIPSKFAKSPEALKQEKNLKYVARTRAKEEMYFLNVEIKSKNSITIQEI